ncbi:sugar phosphate isomerase/epimerase, partial [Desulfovibrio sp. DS-1]
ARVCGLLLDRVAFLGAHRAVLHPPTPQQAEAAGFSGADGPARLLAAFLREWTRHGRDPACLLLENIAGQDLTDLLPVIGDGNCKVCLDMGHVLTYGQHRLPASAALLERVGMVHVHAPGGMDRHRALTELTAEEAAWAARVLPALPPDAVLMVEVFAWDGVLASLPVLERLLDGEPA